MSAHTILCKKGILRVPFFIFIVLISTSLLAQSRFTPELKSAMIKISEMRFQEADKQIERARLVDPSNFVADYLEAANLCISLFLNENQNALKQNQDRLDLIINRIENMPESDPYRDLFLGEIYVAQAILNGKFKNNLTAAWQFYKAYQHLTHNYQSNPEFLPNYIPLGVLYCAIGSLPEDYRKLASLLGFEGSVSKGMALLNTAYYQLSTNPSLDFYTNYAGFVYSFISFQLNPSEGISPRSLGMDLTSSSFLLYLQARINYEQGKVKEAAHWLDRRPRGSAYAEFHHLDYLQGKYLLGIEPERSKDLLTSYIRNSPTDLYIKSSFRYLSWYYLLSDNQEASDRTRLKVLSSGSANTGADRQAQIEAQNEWNETLVKARVLFDAAKYEEALLVLNKHSIDVCCKSASERAEYYYRKGRINQEIKQYEVAKKNFTRCLAFEEIPDCYALGNAALQLALMAEAEGDVSLAKTHFKKALSYDQYPFYEGIHQKAKAGIDRLK